MAASGCAPPGSEAVTDGTATQITPFELDGVTVDELQRSMESGERTARSITELYLSRIEEIDGQGPGLRSIIETNPDALAIADELDAERRERGPRGPLHGVPVAIKDNIDTHDHDCGIASTVSVCCTAASSIDTRSHSCALWPPEHSSPLGSTLALSGSSGLASRGLCYQ